MDTKSEYLNNLRIEKYANEATVLLTQMPASAQILDFYRDQTSTCLKQSTQSTGNQEKMAHK